MVQGGTGECERISKKLRKLFLKHDLRITTEYGKNGTDYLNIYLDLKNNTYRQWKKPNNDPMYVNKHSSHPPIVLKQIPPMIEHMITRNCSSEEEFDKIKDDYQRSLTNCGYMHILKYNPKEKNEKTQ